MAKSVKFNMGGLTGGISSLESKAKTALKMYANQSALKLQNYARVNAPWQNRTGNARQTLTGTVDTFTDEKVVLKLAHGVDYGKWLELAHNKKFAIIPQTIQYVGTYEIMPGLNILFGP